MSNKTFKIVDDDISDGYHTFDELYEHRCLLYIHLCLDNKVNTIWGRDHFIGWDILCTSLGRKQISYHVPAKYRYVLAKHFQEKPLDYIEKLFDGHTSKDVAVRLLERLDDLTK